MEQPFALTPHAFRAVEAFPTLGAAVAESLQRQRARAMALRSRYARRPRLVAAIEATVSDPHGGLLVVAGPPGSGVSSLLVALATSHPWPIWLPAAAPAGLPAFYAQIVALHRPGVPLIDPAVASDPAALERLLAEALYMRVDQAPIVLLCDALGSAGPPLDPGPLPFPAELPPGVWLILGEVPETASPYPALVSLRLPGDDPDLLAVQTRALRALSCPPAWQEALLGASEGNMLYLHLALAALHADELALSSLPTGLDGLLASWWRRLSAPEQRLAAALAAAGEPLPATLAAEVTGAAIEASLARWEQLGLVDLSLQPAPGSEEETPGAPVLLAHFAHDALPAFVARMAPAALSAVHADLAGLALRELEREREQRRRHVVATPTPEQMYAQRQFARHAGLGGASQAMLARVVGRDWLRDQERREGLVAALQDARWELRAAVNGPVLRLVRAATFAGLVATRARRMQPEAAATALVTALEGNSRDLALKRVLEVVERLPDGLEKAQVLRRLGEVCYAARMRAAAMRLLSRALDLEAQPVSRAWRDARESLLAELAGATLGLGDIGAALAIAERIEHLERRAMVETDVVRHLLASGELDRAQRLARSILHEGMGAWARAEVAVALTRWGDPRGAMLLEEIEAETAFAWAQIELACDEVVNDEMAARERIARLPSPHQRDRGLARLARALAAAGNDGAALAAAEAIAGVDTRVAALIELRLSLEGLVAMLALERATRDIGAVSAEYRAPLVSDLSAALAALGRRERALEVATELPEGEERDRALARVAVTLAQRGDHRAARELLETIADEDERAWAYEELARQLAATGQWDAAINLIERISAADQRHRALAELAIARARAGEPVAALDMARALTPTERARALILIAPELVARDAAQQARAVADEARMLEGAEARARYQAALAIALAEHGNLNAAAGVIASIRRPAERARAGAALARALAARHPQRALAVLGDALRSAAISREETLRALELAVPALAALGGVALLQATAAAVDEIDRW
ncbi:MAG: hypothetical protein RMK84_16645 [Oscillochloridaceae bacterium]|nr:tetratricopeptide repeat protein [Chloroflexaceae bacterium]MDW8391756.1 hypothetical protein [Oscillochloridaceae bacterium]